MTPALIFVSFAAASYFLGAIPFGLLIARAKGVDIRKVGSGNIGATNVFRSVSKSLGILTFTCDMTKGFMPSFVFPMIAVALSGLPQRYGLHFGLICGCAAIAGHNWPIYLKFKGGKGVATSAGVLLGIAPLAVGIGMLAWLVVFLFSRYVSVASIVASLVVAAASWQIYLKEGKLLPIVLTALALLAIWRHKSNIRRLMNGTENRLDFGGKKKET